MKNIDPRYIIIGAIIIAVGFLGSQYMKQTSIEKQKQMEINQENKLKQEQSNKEAVYRAALNSCLREAESDYWSYMRLNGTENDEGEIWANNSVWDRAAKNKQTAIDNCYKRY